MIGRWLKRRREAAAQVATDAEVLIEQFGDGAYNVARMRVIGADASGSDARHWTKVRREIARRTGRSHPDTATRYFDKECSKRSRHFRLRSLPVIAGLVPAISMRRARCLVNRDGRDEPGHDAERAC